MLILDFVKRNFPILKFLHNCLNFPSSERGNLFYCLFEFSWASNQVNWNKPILLQISSVFLLSRIFVFLFGRHLHSSGPVQGVIFYTTSVNYRRLQVTWKQSATEVILIAN